MKKQVLISLLLVSIICNAQIKKNYKTYLDKTLKNYTVYQKPVFTDLNADKVIDAAVIVKNNKKEYCLYSIISDGKEFQVTNEHTNLDEMDLSIEICPVDCDKMYMQKIKMSRFNKIFIYSNDEQFIFGFDEKTKHLKILVYNHDAP